MIQLSNSIFDRHLTMRHLTKTDHLLSQVNHALTTLFVCVKTQRENPASSVEEQELSEKERRQSEGFMRVNHTGEVCAQALYRGQILTCQSEKTRNMLTHSCDEETDHLTWTEERLIGLNGRKSYLNTFWYLNSFFMGIFAGLAGDKWSLGFVEETEIQVDKHLQNHLDQLSDKDKKSRAIINQMRQDEASHADAAVKAGGAQLPPPIKMLMTLHAKVMTTTAYWL